MITIIHGDNIVDSRNYFIQQKKEQSDIYTHTFLGEKIEMPDLMQIIEGGDLFANPKRIFIEELLSKRKAGLELDAIISYITTHEKEQEILLWESKELSKKQLLTFPKAGVKVFKLPKTLFEFLDSLKSGNGKKAVQLFHLALVTSSEELLFYMIIRHMRILLVLSDPGEKVIDEVARLALWQKTKMRQLARSFSPTKLKELYHSLYLLDYQQKTGNLTLSLVQSIDFLLLDL